MTAEHQRPERVTLATDVFEGLMLAVESLPGGQVWKLLAAAHEDVTPYEPPAIPVDCPDS